MSNRGGIKRVVRGTSYVGQVGDAQKEADGVQDVGLAGAVKAGDGIEGRVEAVDFRALAVRLEAVNDHALDEHDGGCGGGHEALLQGIDSINLQPWKSAFFNSVFAPVP